MKSVQNQKSKEKYKTVADRRLELESGAMEKLSSSADR